MVSEVTASVKLPAAGVTRPQRGRHADDDEGELAARTQQQARSRSPPASGTRNRRARPMMSAALMAIRPTTRGQQPQRLARQLAEVDVHADGEEEEAEQQALERLDGGLDRLAELGLGQQQPGDEGAERHRQAGQTAATTALPTITNRVAATNSSLRLGGGDQAEQRPQQQAADDDDDADRQRRIGQRQHERRS